MFWQGEGHNSGCAQRLLRLEDVAVDPLDPPRFKHKRVPAARFSPPPPVLHSPTRKAALSNTASPTCCACSSSRFKCFPPYQSRTASAGSARITRCALRFYSRSVLPCPALHCFYAGKLTLQDQQDWKIPPCVSNWKNQKGYTIPLDKRVAADGRNLQDVSAVLLVCVHKRSYEPQLDSIPMWTFRCSCPRLLSRRLRVGELHAGDFSLSCYMPLSS